jgi:flavin-dependent dehydrogenase
MHIRTDGYTGIAPLPGGLVNVCVVRDLRDFRRQEDFGLEGLGGAILAQAIASDDDLRARFVRARQVSAPVTLGPLALEARAAGCPGLLLAGDAAGFIDPMTGDGLRFALRGGELAAGAALRELDTGMAGHTGLAATRRAEFAGKWRLNRALRAIVASPRGVRAASAIASCWPWPLRVLVGVAGDVPFATRERGGPTPCADEERPAR